MKKIGELQEEFLRGFFDGEFQFNVTNSQEQIAAFIFKYGIEAKDVEIRDSNNNLLISSFGPYINKCADQKYLLDGFQQLLTQLQCDEKNIEFKEPVLSELFPEMNLVSGVATYFEDNWCLATIIFENGKMDLFHVDSKGYYTKPQLLEVYPNASSVRDANKIGLEKELISKETYLMNQLRYALFECWDTDDSFVNAWISTFEELMENNIVQDIEICISIVEKDKHFNRYEDINSYSELASELLNDDCLWDEDNEEDRVYLEENKDNENDMKMFLLKDGWHVSSEGMAIGLDAETLTSGFISARNRMEEINTEMRATITKLSWPDDEKTIPMLEEKLENLKNELSDIESQFSI